MPRTEEAKKYSKPSKKAGSRKPARSGSVRQGKRRQPVEGEERHYWMRCPRCGLGLIETVKGHITTERCTACTAVWADPEDVKGSPEADTKEVFKL